jgi:riboflavin kinase / FMN adenylyltransferase
MHIHHGIDGLKNLPHGTALSIGNFDGIHRGHREILKTARELKSTGLAVVTFEPHPLTVLRPELAAPRLTPLPLKRAMLEEIGVDHLVFLPPTPEVLNLTAEAFWRILVNDVQPAHLVEGNSFNFGKGRGGTVERLRAWASLTSIQLHIVPPVEVPLLNLQVVPVSSSLIRWLLTNGRARDAAICLGQPYTLQGPVIKGHQRGRALGIPTANIDCEDQLIPAEGVYTGRCNIDGITYPAAISIGTLPTFDETKLQVEAHLIGFNKDLYGKTIKVQITDWLREQRKFANVQALKEKIDEDIAWTKGRSDLTASKAIASISITN